MATQAERRRAQRSSQKKAKAGQTSAGDITSKARSSAKAANTKREKAKSVVSTALTSAKEHLQPKQFGGKSISGSVRPPSKTYNQNYIGKHRGGQSTSTESYQGRHTHLTAGK